MSAAHERPAANTASNGAVFMPGFRVGADLAEIVLHLVQVVARDVEVGQLSSSPIGWSPQQRAGFARAMGQDVLQVDFVLHSH